MHDQDPGAHGGCQPCTLDQSKQYNQQGFGIFWTVNEFNGPRQIQNLKHINAWAVDIDTGTKDEQLEKIKSAPLRPTMIIEVKRGYHVYYRAIDANPHHWNAIMLDRLVPYFGADKNARDLARILRVPGYFHMKDPNDPYLVKKIYEFPVAYTEQQMARRFPESQQILAQKEIHRVAKKYAPNESDDLWKRIWELDCQDVLTRMSGCDEVNGEVYSFRRTSKNNYNIYVNGKSTSCWIDQSGRIGSLDNGGPTVLQWLRWYGHDWKKTIHTVKKYCPEVC